MQRCSSGPRRRVTVRRSQPTANAISRSSKRPCDAPPSAAWTSLYIMISLSPPASAARPPLALRSPVRSVDTREQYSIQQTSPSEVGPPKSRSLASPVAGRITMRRRSVARWRSDSPILAPTSARFHSLVRHAKSWSGGASSSIPANHESREIRSPPSRALMSVGTRRCSSH